MLRTKTQIHLVNPNQENQMSLQKLLNQVPEMTVPLNIGHMQHFIQDIIAPVATVTRSKDGKFRFTKTKTTKKAEYIKDNVGFNFPEMKEHRQKPTVLGWIKKREKDVQYNQAIASGAYIVCSSNEKKLLTPPFETVVAHVSRNPFDFCSETDKTWEENKFREAYYRDLHILFRSLQEQKVTDVILTGMGTCGELDMAQAQWIWETAYDLLLYNDYGFNSIFFSAPPVNRRLDMCEALRSFLAKLHTEDPSKGSVPDILVTNVESDVLASALHAFNMTCGIAECTKAPPLEKKIDLLTTALLVQHPQLNSKMKTEPSFEHAGVTQLIENAIHQDSEIYTHRPASNVYVSAPKEQHGMLKINFENKEAGEAFARKLPGKISDGEAVTFSDASGMKKYFTSQFCITVRYPDKKDVFRNPLKEILRVCVALSSTAARKCITERWGLTQKHFNLLYDLVAPAVHQQTTAPAKSTKPIPLSLSQVTRTQASPTGGPPTPSPSPEDDSPGAQVVQQFSFQPNQTGANSTQLTPTAPPRSTPLLLPVNPGTVHSAQFSPQPRQPVQTSTAATGTPGSSQTHVGPPSDLPPAPPGSVLGKTP